MLLGGQRHSVSDTLSVLEVFKVPVALEVLEAPEAQYVLEVIQNMKGACTSRDILGTHSLYKYQEIATYIHTRQTKYNQSNRIGGSWV